MSLEEEEEVWRGKGQRGEGGGRTAGLNPSICGRPRGQVVRLTLIAIGNSLADSRKARVIVGGWEKTCN